MKRKKAYGKGYLEEMTRNQAQVMINSFSEEKMIRFLLQLGFSTDEIIKEARKIQKIVVKHHKEIASKYA